MPQQKTYKLKDCVFFYQIIKKHLEKYRKNAGIKFNTTSI